MWLRLPEEEAELGGAVETSPVSHREDEDAHVALQSGQVLGIQTHTHTHIHMNKTSRLRGRLDPNMADPVTAQWGSHRMFHSIPDEPSSKGQFVFVQQFEAEISIGFPCFVVWALCY